MPTSRNANRLHSSAGADVSARVCARYEMSGGER